MTKFQTFKTTLNFILIFKWVENFPKYLRKELGNPWMIVKRSIQIIDIEA